jgi:hypothetical protein
VHAEIAWPMLPFTGHTISHSLDAATDELRLTVIVQIRKG